MSEPPDGSKRGQWCFLIALQSPKLFLSFIAGLKCWSFILSFNIFLLFSTLYFLHKFFSSSLSNLELSHLLSKCTACKRNGRNCSMNINRSDVLILCWIQTGSQISSLRCWEMTKICIIKHNNVLSVNIFLMSISTWNWQQSSPLLPKLCYVRWSEKTHWISTENV